MEYSEIKRGDIYYTDPGHHIDSEQTGSRPCLVVSNDLFNRYSPNVIVVYLTTREKKDLPTHAKVQCKVPSTALCENVETISKTRLGNYVTHASVSEMAAVGFALESAFGLPQKAETKPAEAPLSAAEIELGVYKNLYNKLLEMLKGSVAL